VAAGFALAGFAVILAPALFMRVGFSTPVSGAWTTTS
jgi:hypothetical protein